MLAAVALGERLPRGDTLSDDVPEPQGLADGEPDGDLDPLGEPLVERVTRRSEALTLGDAEGDREPLGEPLGERLPATDRDSDGEPLPDGVTLALALRLAHDALAVSDAEPDVERVGAADREALVVVAAVDDSRGERDSEPQSLGV